MKVHFSLIATTAALLLSGCGDRTPAKPKQATQNAQAPAVKKPLTPKEVQQIRVSVAQAMDEIPPELRGDFQRLFACDIVRDKSAITGERIRKMTARLKANRSIANCKI